LEKHLSLLRRQNVISSWYDRKIDAGQVIDRVISDQLKSADIILLLVSPDFLHSDYCYDIEMTEAMRRQEAGEAVVIPVILRPCLWQGAPFGKLLATPTDGNAVTQFSNQDEAFLDISRQIQKVARSISSGVKATPAAVPSARTAPVAAAPPMPRSANLDIATKYTDYDQDIFIDQAFETVAGYFQAWLTELKQRHAQVETKFTRMDARRFSAVVYVEGKSRAQCMVFKGGLGGHGRAISFSHQISDNTNSLNESIYLSIERDGARLKPLGMGFTRASSDLLTVEAAAEYYWSLFIRPLQ
jgi:hypothetical protein